MTSRMRNRIGLAGLVLLVAALTVLVARLDPSIIPNLATDARVTASSGDQRKATHLIDGNIWNIGYQTSHESEPWIQLEFREPTLVSRIVIHNRVDCCWAEAAPLTLLLAGDDRNFKVVARTTEAFEKWTAEIMPQQARFLRVQLMRAGSLVLNEIEVL